MALQDDRCCEGKKKFVKFILCRVDSDVRHQKTMIFAYDNSRK